MKRRLEESPIPQDSRPKIEAILVRLLLKSGETNQESSLLFSKTKKFNNNRIQASPNKPHSNVGSSESPAQLPASQSNEEASIVRRTSSKKLFKPLLAKSPSQKFPDENHVSCESNEDDDGDGQSRCHQEAENLDQPVESPGSAKSERQARPSRSSEQDGNLGNEAAVMIVPTVSLLEIGALVSWLATASLVFLRASTRKSR